MKFATAVTLATLLVFMAANDNAFAGDTSGTDEVTCLRASDMYLVQGSPSASEASAEKQLVFMSHGKAVVAVSSELIGVEGTAVNTAYVPQAPTIITNTVASRFEFTFKPTVALK